MARHGSGYAVGYGKPPQHTRFRKGRSGNPGGRPRRAIDLAKLIDEALDRPAGTERQPRMTQREAIVARLVERAAEGDLRATHLLFGVVERGEGQAEEEPDPDEVKGARERLVDAFDRLAAEAEAEAAKGRQEELMIYDEALWRQPAGVSGIKEPL